MAGSPPAGASLRELAAAARDCTACELYKTATQTVFGSGARQASIMLVGEQPGDAEDRTGEPFVGPAGKLLDRALHDAGLDRANLYLTNAVKHFRWEPAERGKRRIHRKPATAHVHACHPWLVGELDAVRPRVLVALGATAARALFGSAFRLTQHRGERLAWPPERGEFADHERAVEAALATIHPSAVLRGDDDTRAALYDGLVGDLTLAREAADH